MEILTSVLTFFAGLGVFLAGMKLVSSNMQGLAANKIKDTLNKVSDNKLAGVGLGVGASFLMQSSTATTVIVISMVNAGLISLYQSALIIMGANIGTTFTVLLFSVGYLPLSEILAVSALAGIFVVIASKNEKVTRIGWIVAGFGFIFIGLDTMERAVVLLKDAPFLAKALLSLDSLVVLTILGLLFSAITQSSNATTGIVITLAQAGLMPITGAFAVIMGSNVGTCVTAMLAGMGTAVNARRAALIHLFFNAAGVVLFLPFLLVGRQMIENALKSSLSPSMWVAYFHIAFNIVTTLALLPFAKSLTDLSVKVIPEVKKEAKKLNKVKKVYKIN